MAIAIDTEADESLMTNRLAKIVDMGLAVLICLGNDRSVQQGLGSLFKFSHWITDTTDRSFPQTA